MTSLYSLLTFIVSILLYPLFHLTERGRDRIKERYGFWNLDTDKELIWFHAASVGEVKGILPVLKELRKQDFPYEILVTASSANGLREAKHYADHLRLLPYDNLIWLRRATKHLRIKLFVVSETEIWPNLFMYMSELGVIKTWINARISEKTLKRYSFFSNALSTVLKTFHSISAADIRSARFLSELCQENIPILGNTKYDFEPSISSAEEARNLAKKYFAESKKVVVLGSLRPAEDDFWFPAIAKNQNKFHFIVAPRHKEKFVYFEQKLRASGIDFVKYSELTEPTTKSCVLLDAMGQLEGVYSFATLAFVGATLVPIGGHNPLEPAVYGNALVLGPFYSNISDIVEGLEEEKAVRIVKSSAEIEDIFLELRRSPSEFERLGSAAKRVAEINRGATQKIVSVIQSYLESEEVKRASF